MYSLPKLPYTEEALEPAMSRVTVATHYGKHHKKYVDNVNDALAKKPIPAETMEAIVHYAAANQERGLGNNAGQAWNHGFYWESMADKPTGAPSGAFAEAVAASFGDLAKLREAFIAEGVAHFGSGWVWLLADRQGALKVASTHDGECAVTIPGVTPILVCDLWEHAYYLDFKNDRKGFLETWWDKLVNWRFAEAQFDAARAGEAGWRYPLPSAA